MWVGRRAGEVGGGDRGWGGAHCPDLLWQGRGAGSRALRTGQEVKLSSAVIDSDSITS